MKAKVKVRDQAQREDDRIVDDNFMSEFLRDQARIANIKEIRLRLAEARAKEARAI